MKPNFLYFNIFQSFFFWHENFAQPISDIPKQFLNSFNNLNLGLF